MKSTKQESSRCNFIKQLSYGFAAAGMVPIITEATAAGALSNQIKTMAEKKIGWALVGLGKFTTQQLIPAFPNCK